MRVGERDEWRGDERRGMRMTDINQNFFCFVLINGYNKQIFQRKGEGMKGKGGIRVEERE